MSRSTGSLAQVVGRATLTRKYQITIPSAVRRRLGLVPGDAVYLAVEADRVLLRPLPGGWTAGSAGLGAELWADSGSGE